MSARRPDRSRTRWPVVLLGLVALAIVFLLGVGLGLALEERPRTGETRTSVRTFQPPRGAPAPTTATTNVTVP